MVMRACKRDGLSLSGAIDHLEKKVASGGGAKTTARAAHKRCPACGASMRKEIKGSKADGFEAVWHCTTCAKSEYIGPVESSYSTRKV